MDSGTQVIAVNSRVWLEDKEECFALAEVVADQGDDIAKVKLVDGSDRTMRVPWNRLFPANPEEQDGVPDSTQLMYLHDAALLHNIRYRYSKDNIYTYTAFILTVVNPFKPLGVYGADVMAKYLGKPVGQMPPHIFGCADRAFRRLRAQDKDQSIVVSGESGSGKTETCKHIMQYLTHLSMGSGQEKGDAGLEQKILETNPILEAFGNSRTTRNNNSSRFGKFTQILFDGAFRICGASIVTYLLEKSRVVFQAEDERNYHVFYELLAGASADMRETLKLHDPDSYTYLNQSGRTTIDGVDDAGMFIGLQKAMRTIGIREEQQQAIWRLLSGLLHLGNVEFRADRSDHAVVSTSDALSVASGLLEVSEKDLEVALCRRTMSVPGEKKLLKIPLNVEQAVHSRDGLAKDVYGRLFDCLVLRINDALSDKHAQVNRRIGILDIFGFEFFQTNSFEQFCINYANEKLQQHFNTQVLAQELELYQREAIAFDSKALRSEDNTDVIDLIEDRQGILALLDAQCRMPKATSKTFTRQVHDSNAANKRLKTPRMTKRKEWLKYTDEDAFAIRHFAEEVCYDTSKFLAKNDDTLLSDLEELIKTSQSSVIHDLYFAEAKGEGASVSAMGRKPTRMGAPTVGRKFRMQLKQLATDLSSTSSHFVRCVKPNPRLAANMFVARDVMNQLRYSGMLDVLILMSLGYPTRVPFDDLFQRFHGLMPKDLQELDASDFCEALMMALDIPRTEYKLGITRVFFRAGKLAFVDALTNQDDQGIADDVVRRVRGWMLRKKLHRCQLAVVATVRLQRRIRRMRAFQLFARSARVMTRIAVSVMPIARRIKQRRAASLIQSVVRMFGQRRRFLLQVRHLVTIQRTVRGYLVYKQFRRTLDLIKQQREEQKRRLREAEQERRSKMQLRASRAAAAAAAMEAEVASGKTVKSVVPAVVQPLEPMRASPAAEVLPVAVPQEGVSGAQQVVAGVDSAEFKELVEAFHNFMEEERTRWEEKHLRELKNDLRLKELEDTVKQLRRALDMEREARAQSLLELRAAQEELLQSSKKPPSPTRLPTVQLLVSSSSAESTQGLTPASRRPRRMTRSATMMEVPASSPAKWVSQTPTLQRQLSYEEGPPRTVAPADEVMPLIPARPAAPAETEPKEPKARVLAKQATGTQPWFLKKESTAAHPIVEIEESRPTVRPSSPSLFDGLVAFFTNGDKRVEEPKKEEKKEEEVTLEHMISVVDNVWSF